MRIKIAKKFLPVVIAGVLLMTLVPAVMAYEAHAVNVTAHVKERFNVTKTMRLATALEIATSGIIFPNTPNPQPPGDPPPWVTDPAYVPVETCVVWMVIITVSNPHEYWIYDVVVKDNFSAELAGEPLGSMPVDLLIKWHSRGKAKTEKFATQYRIIWYVDRTEADPSYPPLGMEPGGSATLYIMVWTKLNPAGKQEYTSPGNYTLNSGATLKWLDPDGHQFSTTAPSLEVEAYVP